MSHLLKKIISFFSPQSDSLILSSFYKLVLHTLLISLFLLTLCISGASYLTQKTFENQLIQLGTLVNTYLLTQPNINFENKVPDFIQTIKNIYPIQSIYACSFSSKTNTYRCFDVERKQYIKLPSATSALISNIPHHIEFKKISSNLTLLYSSETLFLSNGKIFIPTYYFESQNIDEFGGNIREFVTANNITGYLEITVDPSELQVVYYGFPCLIFLCFAVVLIFIFRKNYTVNTSILGILNRYLIQNVYEIISNQTQNNPHEPTSLSFIEFSIIKDQLFKLNKFVKKQQVEREKAENTSYQTIESLKNKEQYFANVVHELRNPISIFNGFLELFHLTKVTKTQRDYLQHMNVSNAVVHQLINDLLDLSKMNVGKFTLHPERIHFYEVLYKIVSTHIIPATKKNLELIFNFDQKLPLFLIADRIRLHQIISNLITNAIKFTEQGCIFTSVRLLHQNEFYAHIQFEIKDQGIGMSPEELKKLFHPFEQVHHHETNQLGTGLGLVICRKLIEQMNGSINAESMKGQGTTMFFTLQLQKCEVHDSFQMRYKPLSLLNENDQVFYYSSNASLSHWFGTMLSTYYLTAHKIKCLDQLVEQFELYFQPRIHQHVNHILLIDFNKKDLTTENLKEFFKMLDILVNAFEYIQLYVVIYLYSIDKPLIYNYILQEMTCYANQALFTLCFLEKPLDYQKLFSLMNTIRGKSVKNVLDHIFTQQHYLDIENITDNQVTTLPALSLAKSVPSSAKSSSETTAIPIVTQTTQSIDSTVLNQRKKLRILIVDDHDLNRQLLVSLLQHDYQFEFIREAVDGLEAVKMCQLDDYDIIFMDIQMPNMDGLKATQAIRHLENHRPTFHPYIIGLTANTFGMAEAELNDIGMNQCLLKPFSRDVLNTVVNTRLEEILLQNNTPSNKPVTQTIILEKERETPLLDTMPILDRQLGIQQAFGQEAAWQQAIQMLWEMIPEQIQLIEQYYELQEWQKMRRAVHKLHGGTSYCGTVALKNALKNLENTLIKEQFDHVPELFHHMMQEKNRLLALKLNDVLTKDVLTDQ